MSEVASVRPLAAILLAFVAVAIVVCCRRWPAVRDGTPIVASLCTFALIASMSPDVLAGRTPTTTLGTLVAGVDLSFQADPLGMIFALVASGLWVLTSIYSVGYIRGTGLENRTRYTAALCLSLGASFGVAFASNILVLVVFYELTTVGTYALVVHSGTDRARRVGYEYVAYVIGGGTLLIGGAVIVYTLVGTVAFAPGGIDGIGEAATETPLPALLAIGALLVGFGVKGAVMPLHAWLPKAMVAPTTVSGVLHAVVVVKSGVFGIARTVLEVFGPETTAQLGVATPLAIVAGLTIVLGSLLALRQDDLKRRLAYSTVAQLSYVVLGIALLTPMAVVGGLFHIAAHAVAKLALFFCVGVLAIETDVKRVSDSAGVGHRLPLTMGVFAVGAVSLAGLPLFAGFASKWYLLVGGVSVHPLIPAVLILSGALNVAYLWPIVYSAFFETPERADVKPLLSGPFGGERTTTDRRWQSVSVTGEESRVTLLGPLLTLAGLVVALGIFADHLVILELAQMAAEAVGG